MEKQKPALNISEYIAGRPKEVAARLSIIRKLIHKLAPKAEEAISYGMPAFKQDGVLIYFCAFEKHIGFYPYPSALKEFKEAAKKYKTGKGSIQFPHDEPLPIPFMTKIIKFRLKEKMQEKKTKAKK